MVQMTKCNRHHSGQVNIFKLISKVGSPQRAAEMLNARFDGVVITLSNILRPRAKEPGMGDLVRHLTVPVYCLGIGLQNDLPMGDPGAVSAEVLDLMRALDDHATLFGTRGQITQNWLKSIGIRNAKAIGCPSMFVYPSNILSISAPTRTENIMTAGHVAPTMDPNNSGQKLMRGFRGKNAAYVLQTEHKMLKEFMHVDGVYNEATQTVSKAHMSQAIEKECGVSPPFSEFLSFSDVSAWRQAARRFDLYVGDRIHGGVAAMQVGVPSLVLHADTRVQELTSYHGIPSCPLDEFAEIGAEAAIARYLSPQRIAAFHESYRDALGRFEAATAEAGLQLHNRLQ